MKTKSQKSIARAKALESETVAAASRKPGARAATGVDLHPGALKLKRLLVPLDFSEYSQKAMRYATRFAEQFGASLILLHVVEPVVQPAELGYSALEVPVINIESLQKHAASRLTSWAREEVEELIPVTSLVRVGKPWHQITEVAREHDADLIIIPTHGYTGLKHLFLGSTAERVVRHAPCPVLVVREKGWEQVPDRS